MDYSGRASVGMADEAARCSPNGLQFGARRGKACCCASPHSNFERISLHGWPARCGVAQTSSRGQVHELSSSQRGAAHSSTIESRPCMAGRSRNILICPAVARQRMPECTHTHTHDIRHKEACTGLGTRAGSSWSTSCSARTSTSCARCRRRRRRCRCRCQTISNYTSVPHHAM